MPVTITLSATTVAENVEAGTVIGTFTTEGGLGNEEFTYSLADAIDDRFEIVGDQLVVKTGGSLLFDYENDALKSFSISVTASGDKDTTSDATTFTIEVTDNVAPTDMSLSSASIVEQAVAGTEIGELSAIDPDLDDSFTFTLTDDAEGRFEIVGTKLLVKDGAKLDYLTATSHQVTVQVTDSDGNTFNKVFTIDVTDALELVTGSRKNDRLFGSEGGDSMEGGAGNDKIYGRGGDDVINGGLGKDMLYGGEGKDTFVFDAKLKKGHFDHIKDFNPEEDVLQFDLAAFSSFKIKVSKKDFALGKKSFEKGGKKKTVGFDKIFEEGKLEKKFFKVGNKAKDSDDFITYDRKKGTVYFDADGAGGKKGIEILKVKPGTALSVDDFLFI